MAATSKQWWISTKESWLLAEVFSADEEAFLLQRGSSQMNLWGINLHFDLPEPDMVEFDSIINIRPRQGNSSRAVEDSAVRDAVMKIVGDLVQ